MWITHAALRRLGFRQTRPGLWLCFRRYGLHPEDHLTLHDWSPPRAAWVELSAFHWTHAVRGERLHVYYREEASGLWLAEGRTPRDDVLRLGACPDRLQAEGDAVAARLLGALGEQHLVSGGAV